MPDLNRCSVCNRRAELNSYGECPTCQDSIESTLEGDGFLVRPSRDLDFDGPRISTHKNHGRRVA